MIPQGVTGAVLFTCRLLYIHPMSTRRTSRDTGWINPSKLPRGVGGRALCRWCHHEVGPGRLTFCSAACVHQHKLRSNPGYMREHVFKRDHGICAICRVDTMAQQRQLYRGVPQFGVTRRRIERETGVPGRRSPWDADHIVPVAEGGGECDLSNIRTLCRPCHRQVTAELSARLALRRRLEVYDSCPERKEPEELYFTIDEAL